MERNGDDIKRSLLEIAGCHGKSVVSLMLDIQDSKLAQDKILSFIRNLECLSPDDDQPTLLSRRWINAFESQNYVALSYTWAKSEHEDPRRGRYKVQTRDQGRVYPSPVRDCVFDRILKYMRRFQLNLLWMDRHSIKQRACGQIECSHSGCNQKRDSLQTMDLVYKLSKHPVALLGRPIKSRYELALLAKILTGELVSLDRQATRCRLSKETTRMKVGKALMLLREVTSDLWWTRAWTFQESYRSGNAMRLLIPHPSSLEKQKRSYTVNIFGDIDGELCINSVRFSFEATRLCLAFQDIPSQTQEESEAICHVLATAGRYTVILKEHESMSPTIISDIANRDVTEPWDRLAIAANCCQYPIRLNIQELQRKRHSISLSMLAMYLLNGEILCNRKAYGSPSQMTVSRFLKNQSFKGFYSPLDKRSLSFNKGCRFTHVKLTADGILTKGHIWQLGRVICSRELDRQPSWVDNPTGKLDLHERKRLTQLANKLRSLKHFPLERRIRRYLRRDSLFESDDIFSDETYAESYKRMMASELVNAIDRGMKLRLGSLWEPSGRTSPYKAVFIWDSGEEIGDEDNGGLNLTRTNGPALIFTASRPEIQGSDEHHTNDIDRHVSLEVRHMGFAGQTGDPVPRLYIKRWLLGLCFFEGCPRRDVVFPWPPGLEAIVP